MKVSKIFLVGSLFLGLSLQQCCNYQGGNKMSKDNIAKVKSLPQGSADISCTIIGFEEKGGINYYSVKVDSVNGYGTATKPIGIGSIIQIESKDDSDSNSSQNNFELNSQQRFIINSFPGSIRNGAKDKWKISRVK